MKYRIVKSEDIEDAREMHKQTFPDDVWVGDDHDYWFAIDESGRAVAFASAIYYPECRGVYLSRCGVLREAVGCQLQSRLIRCRVAWARRIGADFVFTFTTIKNYPSIVNLLRAGFRFHEPTVHPRLMEVFHMYVKMLCVSGMVGNRLEMAEARVAENAR